MKNKKPLIEVNKMKHKTLSISITLLFIAMILGTNFALAKSDEQSLENTLYVNVIEQVGDPARILTNAKVTLAYGSLGGEQSLLEEWQDVPVDETGQAIFSNVQPGVYRVYAKASGYISSQKEFTKQAGVTGYITIALTQAPAGTTGSIKVALLKIDAPQTKEYIRVSEMEK